MNTATGPRVLIADDSPLVLRMIEKMLNGAGIGTVTARDGVEAVEKAITEHVSLVVLDVMMPRINGYQVCRLLKSEPATRSLPVVILTSRDQAGDRFWGLETGADYYITKDSEPQKILELVRKILGEASRASPASTGPLSTVDILSRANELLDRKLYEATILTAIGQVARSLVRFDETFTSVLSVVGKVVDFTVGSVAFVEESGLEVALMLHRPAAAGVVEETKTRLLAAIALHTRERPAGHIQARLFAPTGAAGRPEETVLGGFAAFPILTSGALTGLLALSGREVARMTPETEAFLQPAANQAYIVMENSRLFEQVKRLSIRDGLTDLFNHKHILGLLRNEFERSSRYGASLSVLMADLDHFKAVNDRHGHAGGDTVLRETARLLREALRAVDAVGRYGGEEFMAVLPYTGAEDARATAERVRVTLAGREMPHNDTTLRVTASIGVATFPASEVDSWESLVRVADERLYQAKAAGRNRVVGAAAAAGPAS